jgi:predicted GTPase
VSGTQGARIRTVILGAGGRDFHDFNVVFRDDPCHEVVAFTAAQIPDIAGRVYPPSLAGPLYPDGIPIRDEAELPALLRDLRVAEVIFAYSDVAHEYVMHRAALALAHGASFRLLGPEATMLGSRLPVVSVCAVRTGCGKSPAARYVAALLRAAGLRVAVVRHPMPYGDLAAQAVQRFASLADIRAARCTLEEAEEYEPHVACGDVVFAGVDYVRVLAAAEAEADVVVWDGGNNDFPFLRPDLEIVLVDPHRAGDEERYFPGEVNLRRAHVVVVTKVDSAPPGGIAAVRAAARRVNPQALVVEAALPIAIDAPEAIAGRRVLVIEDGPTLAHGDMPAGAGAIAARRAGAAELVDPRPHALGSLRLLYDLHPGIGPVLPATGYGDAQVDELARTIRATPCDAVVIATPVDLRRVMDIGRPVVRVSYEFAPVDAEALRRALAPVVDRARAGARAPAS